jgi:hypothetical protein
MPARFSGLVSSKSVRRDLERNERLRKINILVLLIPGPSRPVLKLQAPFWNDYAGFLYV